MDCNAEIDRVVGEFLNRRYLLDMGRNKLARYLKTEVENILIAKKIVKKTINYGYINPVNEPRLPKILIIDIETAPLRAYIWSRWKQNIYLDQTLSEWFMLTWSAKWLFSPDVMSDRLNAEEVFCENDGRIVTSLWHLLNEADILVAHNGDAFDVPKINSRLILNGLPPATPYQTIDTKKISAKQFGFSSNKLDALAGYFGFKVKLDTDFKLWSECMKGNEQSLAYMEEYNRHDVELLEEVYLKLRPWMNAHPNVALYVESDKPLCTHCGSDHLTYVANYYTQTGKFETYRCECGALNRMRKSVVSKDVSKSLMISTAR
jgi:hypothetical protein